MKAFGFLILLVLSGCGGQGSLFHFDSVATPSELAPANQAGIDGTQTTETWATPEFEYFSDDKVLPKLPGASWLIEEGLPIVPFVVRKVALKDGEDFRAELLNPKMEVSRESARWAEGKPSLVWGGKRAAFSRKHGGKYYPGKLFDTQRVGNEAVIRLFPIQIDLGSGRILRLRKTEMLFRRIARSGPEGMTESLGPQALVISSDALALSANALVQFQKSTGVRSERVLLSELPSDLLPLEELPPGYKTPEEFNDIVIPFSGPRQGYDFSTARRLMAFLKNAASKFPSLKYVTLLGDSLAIPPSYYFSVPAKFGKRFGVTDVCYGAFVGCALPRLAVGRLPFTSAAQVQTYLAKARYWLRRNFKHELSLYGGRAFAEADVYVGELSALEPLDVSGADWRSVNKHFLTDGTFQKGSVLGLASGKDPSALVYFLDHGKGNQWYAGKEIASSLELAAAGNSGSLDVPFVVSPSCVNAAFDEALSLDDSLAPLSSFGKESVGTTLLKSRSGAVAYLGVSRDSQGAPSYEVDEYGNILVLGTTFSLQLFARYLDNYRIAKGGRIGDHLTKALRQYVFENGNDLAFEGHAWTFWITTLLGDPTLPLPERTRFEKASAPPESRFPYFDFTMELIFPGLFSPVETPVEFPLAISESPVEAKLLRVVKEFGRYQGEEWISDQLAPEKTPLELKFSQSGEYLLKLVNTKGVPRERHVQFELMP